MPKEELAQKIARLKRERGAAILAHNYQPPEIQDIADHLGDSLDLSRLAQRIEKRVIIFCCASAFPLRHRRRTLHGGNRLQALTR